MKFAVDNWNMLGHGFLVVKINVLPFESIKKNIERLGQFSSCLEPTCSKMQIVFSIFRPNISILCLPIQGSLLWLQGQGEYPANVKGSVCTLK